MGPSENSTAFPPLNGALLIHKHAGISSFGVIEELQKQLRNAHQLKRRDMPKLGHGGTLDPFATGLLVVCVGRAVKLAQYFLGSTKIYEGTFKFGETTIPGDPTAPVSETSPVLPENLEQLRELARTMTLQPYLQIPPMHSAKKKDGKPLYELARAGIEVEREPKLCRLFEFEMISYQKPIAAFRITCSSGTYIRTLAQDFAKMIGSVALVQTLSRTGSGSFLLSSDCMSTAQIETATQQGQRWDELPCWIPFDRLLEGYPRAEATPEEAQALMQGRQNVLFNILRRAPSREVDGNTTPQAESGFLAIYCGNRLIAIARKEDGQFQWNLDRVFTNQE